MFEAHSVLPASSGSSDYSNSLLPRLRRTVEELPALTDSDKERERRYGEVLKAQLLEREAQREGP